MDVPLLRTLTLKSRIGFGQFRDLTVSEIIDLAMLPYLRWLYFNMEGLTFTNEILINIKIDQDFRIEKPGRKPELHEKLMAILGDKMVWESKRHMKKRMDARNNRKSIAIDKFEKRFQKKSLLCSLNRKKM
jgi:hypothetical protein